MVDFELGKTHRQVKEFIHQFAQSVVRPMSLQADREHKIPEDFLLRLSQMQAGMQMGEVPEEVGGEGGGVGETARAPTSRRSRPPAARSARSGC
jgi:hypothetical protein